MTGYSEDWQHVKLGLGIIGYSAACALVGFAFGRWLDASEASQRLMWLMAAASLPWGVGILAAKIVFRFEDHGQAAMADWHWGQVVMGTLAVLICTAVGLSGFFATLILLDGCDDAWHPVCKVGQWTYGIIGLLYAIALVLVAPFVLWWDAFAIRGHRAKLTLETNLKGVYEAGRAEGRREGTAALKRRLRERREQRRLRRLRGG